MSPSNPNRDSLQIEPVELSLIEERLKDLRSRISDEGQEIDAYKARTAAATGGGIFLLLLAAGSIYDLFTGNASIWSALDITPEHLYLIAGGLTGASLTLFAIAALRERRRDRSREERLVEMEQEFAQLLERKDAISQTES